MRIRTCEERDRETVVALAARLPAGAPPWRDGDRWVAVSQGWVAEALEVRDAPGHAVLVADDEDTVVGFVVLDTRRHVTGDLDAYVAQLVVAADHEGRGLGRLLLAAAETWARDLGATNITLHTGARNTRSRALYAAVGFQDEELQLTKPLNVTDARPDAPT